MLEIQNLTGGYGDTTVLRDVSISVPDASVVALLGPNGAGKTTTLRMASGLARPKQGSITLDGEDITKLSPYQRARRGLCLIPKVAGSSRRSRVRENLTLYVNAGPAARGVRTGGRHVPRARRPEEPDRGHPQRG